MSWTWKEIGTAVVMAVLIVVICLILVDVISGFYVPVSSPDGY